MGNGGPGTMMFGESTSPDAYNALILLTVLISSTCRSANLIGTELDTLSRPKAALVISASRITFLWSNCLQLGSLYTGSIPAMFSCSTVLCTSLEGIKTGDTFTIITSLALYAI